MERTLKFRPLVAVTVRLLSGCTETCPGGIDRLLMPVRPERAVFTWCSTDCDPAAESMELPEPVLPAVEDAGTL